MSTQKKAFIALCILSSTIMLGQMSGTFLAYIMESYPEVPPVTVMSIISTPALVALFGVYFAALMLGLGMSLTMPYIMGHIMLITPPRYRTFAMSLVNGGMSIGMFLAPFVLSYLSGLLGGGISNALLVAAIACGTCAFVSLFLFSLAKQQT